MNINPIVLSIPVFFLLIGIELLVERFMHQKFYRLPDAIANISCGITSQLSGLLLLSILAVAFDWPMWYHGLTLVYFMISFIWFYYLQRQHEHVQMA